MYGPVTLKIDGEMKFYPRGAATQESGKFRVQKNQGQKNRKKGWKFYFLLRFQKGVWFSILTTFFIANPPRPTSAYPTSGGGTFDSAEIPGSNFGSEKIQTKKIQKKVEKLIFVAISKTRPVFNFDHFFRRRPPNPLVQKKE